LARPRFFVRPIAVGAALSVLVACGRGDPESAQPAAPPPPAVKLVRPHRGEIARTITLPSNVRAWQEATLFAKVTGYLKTITVDKGDEVAAGALIADIEVPELLADRVKTQAEVEVAAIDYRRLADARKKAPDLVIPQTVDEAAARQKTAAASLERIKTLLGFTRITAPFAGVITQRFVDPGAFIPAATAGSTPQNAAIVSLSDFTTVRIYVAIPEPEVPFVTRDTPVVITVQELPGQTFSGTVTRFAYALDDATRTMLAEVDLPNPQRELRPGMYATVKLSAERHRDALLVPLEFVLKEASGRSVFIVDGEQRARKTPIKTGFEDDTSVEVLDGLAPDQPVVVLGKQSVQDGQPVHVVDGSSP
jgi:membrane fusion protein, multidrug efflux system